MIEQTEPIEGCSSPGESDPFSPFSWSTCRSIKDEADRHRLKATIDWLEGQDDPEANKAFYAKALKNLKLIEDGIPRGIPLDAYAV